MGKYVMTAKALSRHEIIMNFSRPPTLDDLEGLAQQVLESMPDELVEACEDLTLQIEEFPDETLVQDMELESEYELIALFRSGSEVAPGVKKKIANDDDTLVLFRRPLLDFWCESSDDLATLVREVMIEEVGRAHEFTDDDIQKMLKAQRHNLL